VEINTEADHNDLTECPHDDKPSTGMFAVYFCLYILYILFAVTCGQRQKVT